MTPSKRAALAVLVLVALVALLLCLWPAREPATVPIDPPHRSAPARTTSRPMPAPLDPPPAVPPDDAVPDQTPAEEPVDDLEFVPDVAEDAPMCGSRQHERLPRDVPDFALCDTDGLVTVCTASEEPPLLAIDDLAAILDQAEGVVGGTRRTPLVIVFHDRASWDAFAARRRLPSPFDGLYNGAVHIAPLAGWRLNQTVRHEMFHAALDGAVGCAPRSIHEGMASWFAAEPRVAGWIDALRNGFWPPHDLEAAITRRNDAPTRNGAYAQAELRVLHAASGDDGEQAIRDWVGWLRRRDGVTATVAWAALRRATDRELSMFTSELLFDEPSVDPEALTPSRFTCIFGTEPPLLAFGIAGIHARCALTGDDAP